MEYIRLLGCGGEVAPSFMIFFEKKRLTLQQNSFA
jgi:ribonuclease BN (tRNA processing enzyme)